MTTEPLAYFITFRCYGTWLHGDPRGSVAWGKSEYLTEPLEPDPHVEQLSRARMREEAIVFGMAQRQCVDRAIRQTSELRGWRVHALNVRTNHVHVVLTGDVPPEQIMSSLKAWATRRLRDDGLIGRAARIWSRHGSTRYLWTEDDVRSACEYVATGQDASGGV